MKGGPRWLKLTADMGMQSPVGNNMNGMFPNFGWPVLADVPKTDQEIDDEVTTVVDTWTREQQIIAYKLLNARGFRTGSSLDSELSELRRARRLKTKGE